MAAITLGTLPLNSIYINYGMIDTNGNVIEWKVTKIDSNKVLLSSNKVYSLPRLTRSQWATSSTRQYLNGRSGSYFTKNFTDVAYNQLLDIQSQISIDASNALSYQTTTDKIVIPEIDVNYDAVVNDDYFNNYISYSDIRISLSSNTQLNLSNGKYYDISNIKIPEITTFIPDNNLGYLSDIQNIAFRVSNPNNTTDYSVIFKCKNNGEILSTQNNLKFGVDQFLYMTTEMYNKLVSGVTDAKLQMIVTDGLGATVARDFTYTKASGLVVMSGFDYDYGEQCNCTWTDNKQFTIKTTKPGESTVEYRIYIDDMLHKSKTVIANNTTIKSSIDVTTWSKLTPGEHMLKIYANNIDEWTDGNNVMLGTVKKRYLKFTKSPVSLSLTSNQGSFIGKFKDPFTLEYNVSNSDVTHKNILKFLIDGGEIDNKTVNANFSDVYTINSTTWSGLAIGEHTFTIKAIDSTDTNINKILNFTFTKTDVLIKVVTKARETKSIAKTIAVNTSVISSNAIPLYNYTVRVSNNALDSSPVWEDMTHAFVNNETYTFENENFNLHPAIAVEITIGKDSSQSRIDLNGIGYYYSL